MWLVVAGWWFCCDSVFSAVCPAKCGGGRRLQRLAAPSKWAFRSFRTLRNTFRTHLHTRSKFEEFCPAVCSFPTWRTTFYGDDFRVELVKKRSKNTKQKKKKQSNKEAKILCSGEFCNQIPFNTHKISGVVPSCFAVRSMWKSTFSISLIALDYLLDIILILDYKN